MTKKPYSPTVRHALKKARVDVDGPGDTVAVPGSGSENTDTAHASDLPLDTEGDDTVAPSGGKKKKAI